MFQDGQIIKSIPLHDGTPLNHQERLLPSFFFTTFATNMRLSIVNVFITLFTVIFLISLILRTVL